MRKVRHEKGCSRSGEYHREQPSSYWLVILLTDDYLLLSVTTTLALADD
jgi:hypothetical protein